MRLSTRTLFLAAAAAVLVASCSGASVVATIDDATVDDASVVALRTNTSDSTNLNAEAYRADLTNLIYLEAQKNSAYEDFGLTGLDDPDAIAAKIANPTAEEAEILDSVASTPGRTEATVAAVSEQFIIRDEVTAALADDVEYLADVFENRQEMLVEVCVRHILTTTPEEALAAKARIEGGEDFAAVADEISLDTFSAGGQLPMSYAGRRLRAGVLHNGCYRPDWGTHRPCSVRVRLAHHDRRRANRPGVTRCTPR